MLLYYEDCASTALERTDYRVWAYSKDRFSIEEKAVEESIDVLLFRLFLRKLNWFLCVSIFKIYWNAQTLETSLFSWGTTTDNRDDYQGQYRRVGRWIVVRKGSASCARLFVEKSVRLAWNMCEIAQGSPFLMAPSPFYQIFLFWLIQIAEGSRWASQTQHSFHFTDEVL